MEHWRALHIYYVSRNPPTPQGHTAVRTFCTSPAIYCKLSILLSLVEFLSVSVSVSVSVFSVLSCLIEDCWGHGHVKITPKNLIPLNHPNLARICQIICRRLKTF